MNRYHITSKKFTGTIEVWYSATLLKIDLTQATLTIDDITGFKRVLPATQEAFLKGEWCSLDTVVVQMDFEVTFDMFWSAYDKKINKARAMPIFQKLSKTEQVKALMGIKAYDKYLTKEKWRTKADPENYLRNKTWENEYK